MADSSGRRPQVDPRINNRKVRGKISGGKRGTPEGRWKKKTKAERLPTLRKANGGAEKEMMTPIERKTMTSPHYRKKGNGKKRSQRKSQS